VARAEKVVDSVVTDGGFADAWEMDLRNPNNVSKLMVELNLDLTRRLR